jgi:hypothetical protein
LTKLKETNCLKYYKAKIFPNLLLKIIIEIISENIIKVKINNQLTGEHTINRKTYN